MKRFNRISLKGFRRLHNVELELRPLCVMIGANGSGKTSLLDVFSLLSASASGKLKEKISDMQGLAPNLTEGLAQQMSFQLVMEVPEHAPLVYQLTLAPKGVAYEIVEELLTEQRPRHPPDKPFKHIQSSYGNVKYYDPRKKDLGAPAWEHNPVETSLAQVPKMFPEPEDFRSRLASSTHYHALNVESRSPVRLPQPLRPADLPGVDGEDLVSCLFNLRETNRDRFEAIEDTLRAGFADFERLDFPPVAAGTLAMTWRDRKFPHPFFMHQLSEGMLRFLWLVTLLQSPGLTAVTLIDEPEVSLHPELLSLLADLMREASSRTQLVVATHADRLIRFLKPEEVVVLDVKDDGTASATWGDDLDLTVWLQDYSLDDVWRMGRLGGRS